MKKLINGTTYYDIDEMHEQSSISRASLTLWCRTGKIEARKVGQKWWATEAAFENIFRPVQPDQSDSKQVQPPL